MRRHTLGTGPAARGVGEICLGALPFGTLVGEETSFAILDRFVEAGGRFIDTSNNYAFWVPGFAGGESERVLGRWRASRGVGDEVVIATKLGAQPRTPGRGLEDAEGLSASAIHAAVEDSRERLGMDRLDLLYTHIEDRSVPMEETLDALGALRRAGAIGLVGASNHATWRLERARSLAAVGDRPRYEVLQYRYSYLQPRFDIALPESGHVHASPELLDFVQEENTAGRATGLVVYSTLLSGGYTRSDRPLSAPYDHPGTPRRLEALREVAAKVGATPNQVVLAWLLGRAPAMIPLVGASSVEQLEETLQATRLVLDEEDRARLDAAG
ncbi:aldo/keto reductase [Marinactinospora thermotolerans]|uniref:Predicted oxidoreductase n=1 Tax=Marinactinospora thermotolerans DSM 45154 TaxID=1122192 RepID=A0A1T4KC44_9ACTN|nr:aldo/keto reductase [Marinactinospora thermotolerans]SJZ39885.1 Predicted oxidoreductase [Marinactinospora thermotolerans DSM 45154]